MYCVEMYRGRLFIELVILHVVYMSGRASPSYMPVFYIDKCMCVAILRPLALRCAPPSGGLFGRVSRVFVRAREPVCLLVAVSSPSLYVYRCISYLIVTLYSFCYTVNEVSALILASVPAGYSSANSFPVSLVFVAWKL